jgi:hypothetical protein
VDTKGVIKGTHNTKEKGQHDDLLNITHKTKDGGPYLKSGVNSCAPEEQAVPSYSPIINIPIFMDIIKPRN